MMFFPKKKKKKKKRKKEEEQGGRLALGGGRTTPFGPRGWIGHPLLWSKGVDRPPTIIYLFIFNRGWFGHPLWGGSVTHCFLFFFFFKKKILTGGGNSGWLIHPFRPWGWFGHPQTDPKGVAECDASPDENIN
jgi:hypothetical protein